MVLGDFMIVNTNINYSYNQMIKDISVLKSVYSFLQIQNVGYSVLGKAIPVLRLGVRP